jgi:glycosyltransferase involved in cell wall biosynthesis
MSQTVSFFVHDLGSNPVVRALPFARAFQKIGYDVEILGFLTKESDELFSPYKDEIRFVPIRTSLTPGEFFSNVKRLAHKASGELVYAFKPLVTSFAPAYYAARFVERRPLFLDVEDEHIYQDEPLNPKEAFKRFFRGWRLATSWKYNQALQLLRPSVDTITVVSSELQARYGGLILRHGPDEERFTLDPYEGRQRTIREKWDLPIDRNLSVFTGTPRPHKGLDTLIEALLRPECEDWDFVLVGPHENSHAQLAKRELPERTHLLGTQPYDSVPELLSIADAVPIPQKRTSYAKAQVPAKLLDAMAMKRPIIGSRMSDIPEILGEGRRGWLVEPESPASLARALKYVGDNPSEAERRGSRAHEWYRENASTTAIAKKIEELLHSVMRNWE